MPVGAFLDSFPTFVYVAAHVLFFVIGLWAMRRAPQAGPPASSLFSLYLVSQLVFLAFFAGAITMKMGVLIEQTLMVIFVVLLVRPKAG